MERSLSVSKLSNACQGPNQQPGVPSPGAAVHGTPHISAAAVCWCVITGTLTGYCGGVAGGTPLTGLRIRTIVIPYTGRIVLSVSIRSFYIDGAKRRRPFG
jgi:hypothetical protein